MFSLGFLCAVCKCRLLSVICMPSPLYMLTAAYSTSCLRCCLSRHPWRLISMYMSVRHWITLNALYADRTQKSPREHHYTTWKCFYVRCKREMHIVSLGNRDCNVSMRCHALPWTATQAASETGCRICSGDNAKTLLSLFP